MRRRHDRAGDATLKIASIVGARPQFIKAAAVSRVIREDYAGRIDEVMVHTGQHFDDNMSGVFFAELDIPPPKINLNISGGLHGAMTGRMLEGLEQVLLDEKPDWVLVYGDTNSTLAAALAAVKLHVPVAHVEAGLRSFNTRMPEEINRVLVDHVSSLLFCPTETAVANLHAEGIRQGVHQVGDVMYDVALRYRDRARRDSTILASLQLTAGGFALATCHRAENTDDRTRLSDIVGALADVAATLPVVFPVHPRTRKLIDDYGLASALGAVTVIDPLPFVDMIALEQAAAVILTDSGGIQKEAFFYGVPCVTMRGETEWVETVECGSNELVGASTGAIVTAVSTALRSGGRRADAGSRHPYGRGDAAKQMLTQLIAQDRPSVAAAGRDER